MLDFDKRFSKFRSSSTFLRGMFYDQSLNTVWHTKKSFPFASSTVLCAEPGFEAKFRPGDEPRIVKCYPPAMGSQPMEE